MKKIIAIFSVLLMVAAIISGCSANSYSSDLKAEKKLIADYIAREGIHVIYELPENDADWGEKDYYQVNGYDYLYYHLTKRGSAYHVTASGDTVRTDSIIATETVVMRYKKYTLGLNADTADYWTTLNSAYPLEFTYLTDYATAPTAWHVAVGLMKYSDSECKIICPSKLGFTEDGNTVTPYGYDLKMKIKR
jgi:hypothetical protein